MTQNPYAQMGGMPQGGRDPFAIDPMDQRTSLLAVFSLVFSLVCCIPGTGAIGAILGGASLVAINSARGRLRGTGMAVTGIVLGLVVTTVWILMFVTFGSALKMVDQALLKPVSVLITGIDEGDATKVNAATANMAIPQVTDEQVRAFRDAYQAELGSFQSMPSTLIELIRGYMASGPQMQNYRGQDSMPVPATFDKGQAVLLVQMDQNGRAAGSSNGRVTVPVTNIGILLPSGKDVWLLPHTPGKAPLMPPSPPALPKSAVPENNPEETAPSSKESPPAGG